MIVRSHSFLPSFISGRRGRSSVFSVDFELDTEEEEEEEDDDESRFSVDICPSSGEQNDKSKAGLLFVGAVATDDGI